MPVLLLCGCEEENLPEPTPTPTETGKVEIKTDGPIVLSDEGGSEQIAFSATLEWEASSNKNWLKVEPGSGEAGEDITITLTAGENQDYDPKTATVTISSGVSSKMIQVTQKQKGALVLTESSIPVGAEGKTVSITAKANANVSATVDQAAKDWISDVTTKGLVDYVFEFSITANEDESPRSGNIVFSNEYGSETVTIQQEGKKEVPFNVYGKVLCDGEGVPDVLISDGIEIVKTDADGNYRLQSAKKWKYVFMITPSGYEPSALGFLPKIHQALKADVDTAEEVNFTLEKAQNDNYTLLVCGDMHLARRTGDLAQFEKVAAFMNETISKAPGKVYALTLGDMTWDMYWIANNYGFEDYIQTMNGYFPSTTFFHTMGNHDNEMEVGGDFEKALKYTENLTPDYYSFNLGKIHYIVMDDMDFTGVEAGEDNRSKYAKNFTAEELEWLKKDLSYVSKDTPIFVTAHEPLARPSGIEWKEQLDGKDADLDTFIGLFDGYNVRFLSGHTHNIFNKNWTSTFTEHNSGAICASWWWSGYITPGIHIAQDGAPGGFTVWTVNGTDCTHYYQAALQSPDYQFRAYDMNKVKETITADLSSHDGYPKYYNHIQSYGDNVILVNVWDYDDDWKVEISENGTPLDVAEVGVYDPLHIEAMTIPRLNKWNTTTFSTAKWRHFFQATASAADTPVTVKVTDRYGKVFTEEMTRPKAFTVSEYKNETVRIKPEAKFVDGTSSTLVFGWTIGGTAAEDADAPYKLELYKDAGCTDLQVSYEIEKGHSCWGSKSLRFSFGGLQPGTSYWFKVTNMENGDSSDIVEGQTEDFTVVDPTTVSNAGVGDIILAEDLSEISWGADELGSAAGFIPSPKKLNVPSGVNPDGAFIAYDNTGQRIFGTGIDLGSSRISKGWGFFGNSSTYLRNAYLRVGASGGRTHMVTPALSGIPEGKLATIEVTVTATKYDGAIQIAAFAEKGLKINSTADASSSSYKKYTGASLSDGQAFDITSTKGPWETGTVTLTDVDSDCQILIGSLEDNGGKNRFYLSDVVVKIVSLRDPGPVLPVTASMDKATSCSLTYTWTEGVSADDDIEKPWTIALYRDEACTDLVVSHDIPASGGCWFDKDNNPVSELRFIFGGLDPDTDYWFKATDTTEGNVKVSNVVKATTKPFTRVDASKVSNAAVGDIILAEDFSETYGPDEWDKAAGYMPSGSNRTLDPPAGENPAGSLEHYTSTATRLWGNYVQMTPGRRLANGWGFFGNSSVYSRSGYLRVAVTSNGARTHIVTPKLAGIPDGSKATISVTVTALLHEKASDVDVAVFAESGLSMNSTTDISDAKFCKYTGASLTDGHALGLANTTQKKWYTKTVTISGVTNQDHLLIGSLNNVNGKNRFNIADIVVEIVELEDAARTTKVSVIGDSISTFKGWCDTTKGGAYYPKSDGDVSSVTDTWWHKLIYDKMSTGTFEKNISAGNTTIVQNTTGDSSAYWYGWDFGTRLQQLGIGEPDVVLIHGGTNDYGHTSWYNTSEELISGVAMNASSFPSEATDALNALFAAADAATTVSEADALDGTTFCSAYIRLIKMIQTRHPSAKVVCVIGDYLRQGQADAIKLIAQHFGDDKVRVADMLGANLSIPKYSNPHPSAAGMANMANFIYQEVGSWIDGE